MSTSPTPASRVARLHAHLRQHFARLVLTVSLLTFVLWSWLALGTSVLSGLDAHSTRAQLAPQGAAAQVWAAISIVTMPGVLAVVLALVASWAWRRRLRNLAGALLLSVVLGWGGSWLLRRAIARPRPPSPLEHLITYHGSAYPSSHMAMVTTAALMVIATTTTTRQSKDVRYLWRALGVLGVAVVAVDRFVTNAHWPSDIVAGVLVGAMAASLSCLVWRVHVLPVRLGPGAPQQRRVAVIWNPSKVLDRQSFRRTIEWELELHGLGEAVWLQTRADDPGYEMTRAALAQGADQVVVAGGDGTVRVVCSELAGSGVPLGIIPAGTGNLLARNLGIPLDEVAAARVAFGGRALPIDLVRVTIDDDPSTSEHFAVMAGIGIDARIMEATRPMLKRTVGSAAYFIAAPQQVAAPPMELTFTLDDGEPQPRPNAMMAVVGNVGSLQAGIQLFPHASAADGQLDVIVASPRRLVDWAPMLAKVLTRRPQGEGLVDELTGRRIRIEVGEEMPYELDGDTEGRATVFEAEVVPGALRVMQP